MKPKKKRQECESAVGPKSISFPAELYGALAELEKQKGFAALGGSWALARAALLPCGA